MHDIKIDIKLTQIHRIKQFRIYITFLSCKGIQKKTEEQVSKPSTKEQRP